MNQSYEIVETFVYVPTFFTLYVDDSLGFAQAFLHVEDKSISVPYIGKKVLNDHIYSIFETTYIFNKPCRNNIAKFSFVANQISYECEDIHYDVLY